jgi:predicted site-specific integrase-resolvase
MTQRDGFLTASQVAGRLTAAGVRTSEETVRQWARNGRLASIVMPGGRRWFKPAVVDEILSGQWRADEQDAEVAS